MPIQIRQLWDDALKSWRLTRHQATAVGSVLPHVGSLAAILGAVGTFISFLALAEFAQSLHVSVGDLGLEASSRLYFAAFWATVAALILGAMWFGGTVARRLTPWGIKHGGAAGISTVVAFLGGLRLLSAGAQPDQKGTAPVIYLLLGFALMWLSFTAAARLVGFQAFKRIPSIGVIASRTILIVIAGCLTAWLALDDAQSVADAFIATATPGAARVDFYGHGLYGLVTPQVGHLTYQNKTVCAIRIAEGVYLLPVASDDGHSVETIFTAPESFVTTSTGCKVD